jgi:uncharacterized RDD family membrane protein YckC
VSDGHDIADDQALSHGVAAATPPPVVYVGLVTRAIAFVLDAAIINVVATIVGFAEVLIVSLLHFPHELRTIIAAISAGIYVLWSVGYFVGFWSTTGQTPGNRIMRMRVVAVGGEQIKPRRALLRCIGLVLAALPLFAGFIRILFDDRRRGFHDRLARTVVVEAPDVSLFEQRRLANLEASTVGRRAAREFAALDGADPASPGQSPNSGDERASPERHA